jgi:hypothetical protein
VSADAASGRPKSTKDTPDALRRAERELLAGSNRVLDAVFDGLRRAGASLSVYLDRQRRVAWCDRTIRELREDRDAELVEMGRDVYRAFIDGERELPGVTGEALDGLVERCRKVDDYDTRIAAQQLLRERIAAGEADPAGARRRKPATKSGDADAS